MALRAGAGGCEWAHPTETEVGPRGKRPKTVRYEPGQEIDPALLPEKARQDIEEMIAGGILVRDDVVEAAVESIAYHAEGQKVFHTRPDCTEGNNIEPGNRVQGEGGKKLCRECAKAK